MATSSPAPRFVACTLILEVRRGGCGKQVHAGADGGCLTGHGGTARTPAGERRALGGRDERRGARVQLAAAARHAGAR